MNIIVPKNNYVQPTEVREDIVQGIVDALLDDIKRNRWLNIKEQNEGLYLCKEQKLLSENSSIMNSIRVNGAEVDMAFKVLKEAGYYLYGEYEITRCMHSYCWHYKPRFKNREPIENVSFKVFID